MIDLPVEFACVATSCNASQPQDSKTGIDIRWTTSDAGLTLQQRELERKSRDIGGSCGRASLLIPCRARDTRRIVAPATQFLVRLRHRAYTIWPALWVILGSLCIEIIVAAGLPLPAPVAGRASLHNDPTALWIGERGRQRP